MYLPLQYNSVRNYLLILVYSISSRTRFATDHTIRDLYVYRFNPIDKQIQDKDIFLRPVYANIFKLKLMLVLAFVLTS